MDALFGPVTRLSARELVMASSVLNGFATSMHTLRNTFSCALMLSPVGLGWETVVGGISACSFERLSALRRCPLP